MGQIIGGETEGDGTTREERKRKRETAKSGLGVRGERCEPGEETYSRTVGGSSCLASHIPLSLIRCVP